MESRKLNKYKRIQQISAHFTRHSGAADAPTFSPEFLTFAHLEIQRLSSPEPRLGPK
jgi:hypothetical protein